MSFNKIFAKLGSDYKKPDAITTMYEDEFQRKAWCLPVSDLLYVGNATNKKLYSMGIGLSEIWQNLMKPCWSENLARWEVSCGLLLMDMMNLR